MKKVVDCRLNVNLDIKNMVYKEIGKAGPTSKRFPQSHGHAEGLGFSQEGSGEPGINSKQAYDLISSEPLLFRKSILATGMGMD